MIDTNITAALALIIRIQANNKHLPQVNAKTIENDRYLEDLKNTLQEIRAQLQQIAI